MTALWLFLVPHYIQEFYIDPERGYHCIRLVRIWLGHRKIVYDDSYAGGY